MTELKSTHRKSEEDQLSIPQMPGRIGAVSKYVRNRLASKFDRRALQLRSPDQERQPQRQAVEVRAIASTGGNAGKALLFSFLAFVVFPTLLALTYYAVIASDVYVVEAKITVRDGSVAEGKAQTSSILSKFGITKGDNSAQSALILLDYIRSRAIVRDLGGGARLSTIYSSDEIDWLSRMDATGSVEDTWDYWRDRVTASVDTTSNILTLRVRAYTPETALDLSSQIIKESEGLINNISRRSREDALSRAKDEVDRSVSDLADIRSQLLNFQQRTGSIDPIDSAKRLIALVSSLTAKKIEIESQLKTAVATGVAGRPGERSLQSKLNVINDQISDLNELLASNTTNNSVSAQLKEYELLKLREEFSKQIYVISRGSYEQARRNLDRQQLYVATIVRPVLPDSALYPRVFIDSGLVMLALAVFWSISALIVASIKDSAT